MLKHGEHTRYDVVKHDVEGGFVEDGVLRDDFFAARFEGFEQFGHEVRVAFDGYEMLIKVEVAVDDSRKFCKHLIGVVKQLVDVVLTHDLLETVDDFVLDFVGEVVNAAIIVVKRFAVDVGSVGNIFDGDVVDILFRKQFGKGAVDCFLVFAIRLSVFSVPYRILFSIFSGNNTQCGAKACKNGRFSARLRNLKLSKFLVSFSCLYYNTHMRHKSRLSDKILCLKN